MDLCWWELFGTPATAQKTVGEIADELGLAVGTIKTQKARGLAVLKKKIRPYLYCLMVAV